MAPDAAADTPNVRCERRGARNGTGDVHERFEVREDRTDESLREYSHAGVEYVGDDVVDDCFVTASGPGAAREFGPAIAGKLV